MDKNDAEYTSYKDNFIITSDKSIRYIKAPIEDSKGSMSRPAEHEFVIGRLYMSSPERFNLEDKLKELVNSDFTYTSPLEDGKWEFVDREMLSINQKEDVLFARLVKQKDQRTDLIVSSDRHLKAETSNRPYGNLYSAFIIHFASHSIIFEERKPDLQIDRFVKIIETMYRKYFKDLTVLTITLQTEETEILEFLRDKEVIQMTFSLKPSNPVDFTIFKPLDEGMKKDDVTNVTLTVRNKKGLKINGGGIATSARAMGDAAYGHYSARYRDKDKGGFKTFYSRTKIVKEDVKRGKTVDEFVNNILTAFGKYLKTSDKK